MAQTGVTPGVSIEAARTVTFIALKPGLLTGKARDVVGTLHHNALGLENWLAGQDTHITRFDASCLHSGCRRAVPRPIRATMADC